MMRGQRDQSIALAGEERIARDKNPADLMLDKGREGRVDIAFAVDVHNINLLSKGARRRLCVSRLGNGSQTCWVDEHADYSGLRHRLAQQV